MTFSIIGKCNRSGMFGVGITTSSICVASRCSWARARVGALVTQNITDPGIGPRGLDLLSDDLSANQVVSRLVEQNRYPEYRQIAVLDRTGQSSFYSGVKTLSIHSAASGRHCVAAGNLLANAIIPQQMVRVFEANQQYHLAERLLLALEEGLAQGGEIHSVRSAGLLVVEDQPWPLIDLRIDWHDQPIIALRELWNLYKPQIHNFVLWALRPDKASLPVSGPRP